MQLRQRGAPDVSDLIVISAAEADAALRSRNCGRASGGLVQTSELAGFDTPPLSAQPRLAPAAGAAGQRVLRTRLRAAGGSAPAGRRLEPFIAAVERTHRSLVDRSALAGIARQRRRALLAQRGTRLVALVPLRAPATARIPSRLTRRVNAALGWHCRNSIAVLDLKHDRTPFMPLISPRRSVCHSLALASSCCYCS